ncbi:gastrula zinc finger protein xLCGF3.1-like [Narcine bancroftii]|uniref:gastrula zinc finger protein xLCGF3.1-like n=1 Tax=Narcine bancroftii TaxID=1343680 RepID=UPI0038313D07
MVQPYGAPSGPHWGKSLHLSQVQQTNTSCLKNHQQVHTGGKVSPAPSARRASPVDKTLRYTGEKPFTCPKCSKGFTETSCLKSHQQIHTGEKPFTCPKCGKEFAQSCNFWSHQRVHTGEKPIDCPESGKSFAQISTLRTHQNTHSSDRLFVCLKCSRGFNQIFHL